MTALTGWPGAPGVPENPERDGWHWLMPSINHALPPGAYRWHAPPRPDVIGQWDAGYPQDVVRRGYDYLGPCLTPAEVAAARAEARADGMREAVNVALTAWDSMAACEIAAAILAAIPKKQPTP